MSTNEGQWSTRKNEYYGAIKRNEKYLLHGTLASGFHRGVILPTYGEETCLETFSLFLLTSGWQRPGVLLIILQCTEQCPKQRLFQPQISAVPRLKTFYDGINSSIKLFNKKKKEENVNSIQSCTNIHTYTPFTFKKLKDNL